MVDPLRALLDSNAFDSIALDPVRLRSVTDAVGQGRLVLLVTHVQVDEVDAIPDDAKRRSLAALALAPNTTTAGFVVGVSRVGLAAVGTAEENALSGEVTTGDGRHARDALLVSTALSQRALLVTNDRRLTNQCLRRGVPVCDPDELLGRLAGTPST